MILIKNDRNISFTATFHGYFSKVNLRPVMSSFRCRHNTGFNKTILTVLLLPEMLPGKSNETRESLSPDTIPSNTFTVVKLLQSEYSTFPRVSEDGIATLMSMQSTIQLRLGNVSFTKYERFFLTASKDGQIQIEPNFTYINMCKVKEVTVPSKTLTK